MTFKLMRPHLTLALLLFLFSLSLGAAPAHADRRAFTRTYEYMTMPTGELELEIYSQEARPVFDEDGVEFQFQLELEYGITDHWDVSVYHVFEQAGGFALPEENSELHYEEMKLRSRYRFAERGEWPVDLLLYGEAVDVFGSDLHELEGKVILARDFGALTAVVNLIGEVAFGEGESEFEQGFTLGLTYEIVPAFKAGAETWANVELQEGELLGWWAGPAVSWAPSSKFWWAVTAGFGLNDDSDDLIVRSIFGLHL
jgi:hypothetical protein